MNDKVISKESLSEFLEQSLQDDLTVILSEIKGVLECQDIEDVHRQRVAVRRLRNHLQFFRYFGDEALKTFLLEFHNQSNEFAQLLAEIRDLDIQISLYQQYQTGFGDFGIDPYLSRMQENRQILQQKLQLFFAEMDPRQVFAAFSRDIPEMLSYHLISDVDYLAAIPAKTLCQLSSTAMARLYLLDDRSGFDELHQFRKSIRRLRYTLEIYAPWFPIDLEAQIETCHQMQDLLGVIHDLDILLLHIGQTPKEDGVAALKILPILQTARLPYHQVFGASCRSGEIMNFLQNLLHQFSNNPKASKGIYT
jgi:CHAD domain-containing protein